MISDDRKSVTWTPAAPGVSDVNIKVADITNLQQTPPTSAKVMLKILVKTSESSEPVAHTFHFNAPNEPRKEADLIKDTLSKLISTQKAEEEAKLLKPNGVSGSSAAMAIASAVASKPSGAPTWYDDNQLKNDFELQQALMRKDPMLLMTYEEARRTKPDTITNTQFNAQFWSTRVNLLRAFAVESNQQRGAYNVLSAVKPRQEDGELKMRISKEQIQLIFNQHPLVKRVYDENVPKLDEGAFWSRFFLSRLFKKLKGERIVESDSTDPTFDRYLSATNGDILEKRLEAAKIPHLIDIEGNEENQGGNKRGNRQDFTMRPSSYDKAPIIRTLNSLSEKIMENVAQTDGDSYGPAGMDERTFNELALRDLQGDPEEHRIMLNYKQQESSLRANKAEISEEAKLYAQQDPVEIITSLTAELSTANLKRDNIGGLDLQNGIGINDASDTEDEDQPKQPHVGSKSSLKEAQKQVFDEIKYQRSRIHGDDPKSSLSGLSQSLFDRLTLTHATTTEFLHHFWNIFLSGDPDKAGELAKLVETLHRASDRINAVAKDAEVERAKAIEEHKRKIREYYEKTGKKAAFRPDAIGGGSKVVLEMMQPTTAALEKAKLEYERAKALALQEMAIPEVN